MCSGRDRLLVLQTRLAQVAVQVYESWRDDQSGRLYNMGVLRRLYDLLDSGDLAVLDEQVSDPVHTP